MNPGLAHLLRTAHMETTGIQTVSGGDINDSYRITVEPGQEYFVKVNRPGQPKGVITTEASGLELMRRSGVSFIPENVRCVENEKDACLIMTYYPKLPSPGKSQWEDFFHLLARMHLNTNEVFGGDNNFIGLLPQDNRPRNNWVTFYRENRLKPQLEMALTKGYFISQDVKVWDRLYNNLPGIIPIERPALIHGDLWSGNVLPTSKGILLIDPCPYYGHREMDFGMMELFSGIPVRNYFSAYQDMYPLEKGIFDRIEVYQLYYLLVHLNLFGISYLPGVQRIIKKFS